MGMAGFLALVSKCMGSYQKHGFYTNLMVLDQYPLVYGLLS